MTASQGDQRPTAEQMLARIGSTDKPARGACGSTWAWHRAWARRSRCSRRVTDAWSAARTSWSGFVETHGRPRTADLLDGLEVMPRLRVEYRGVVVEEMDTEAILARHPAVGAGRRAGPHQRARVAAREALAGRGALRDAGIEVISTCNVQHLESVADAVATITGAPVNERLPDAVLVGADEIELVDMSPHALRQRMRHGNVYPPERAQVALDRFFTEPNLTALRELSLRFVAGRVEAQLERISTDMGVAGPGPLSERVMVLVDEQLASRRALRRGAAMASALRARLLALTVTSAKTERAPWDRARDLRENLDYAADLGAELVTVEADDLVAAVADQARRNRVSQVVMAHRDRSRMDRLLHRSFASALLEVAPDLEVHLVGPGGEVRDPFTVGTRGGQGPSEGGQDPSGGHGGRFPLLSRGSAFRSVRPRLPDGRDSPRQARR